jgi:hypothetical protein
MEDVKKLEGNFQLHNLNLDGWIEPSDIQNVQDTTFWVEQGWESLDDMVEYVNEQFDVSLYKVDTGNKIADLKVIKKDQEDQSRFEMPVELVLVFKDGSTRPAKEFYQNVITYFKNIMDQYNIQQTDL